jgi:hypothetical protein
MELEHDPDRRKSCSQAIHDHRMRLEALPELTLALSDDGAGERRNIAQQQWPASMDSAYSL